MNQTRTSRNALRLGALLAGAVILAAACGGDDAVARSATTDRQPAGAASSVGSTRTTDSPTEGTAASTSGALNLAVGELPEPLSPLAGAFSKHVDVWGVNIVATSGTDDAKVEHAANVMAQYLDNDADGAPDNQAVVDAMVANGATLFMAPTADDLEGPDVDSAFDSVGAGGQDLYGDETDPAGGFDASLEEVHHLILNTGWAQVFSDQLAQAKGSAIAGAMDIARGAQFDSVPALYPDGAWYTYDDETCDYDCMVTEYTYWAHTSLLGAQEGRSGDIGQEWKLETADKVSATDTAATAILEDPALGLPAVLPDGNYTG